MGSGPTVDPLESRSRIGVPGGEFVIGSNDNPNDLPHIVAQPDFYIDSKPDQAILCFQEFNRHSSMSGADTFYKMGKAYENLGDMPRAAKCYEQVTGYEQHPLYYEARDALLRVQAPLRGGEGLT